MAVRTAIIELKSVDGAIRAEVPLTWKSGPAVSATPSSFFKGKVSRSSRSKCLLVVTAETDETLGIDRLELDGVTIPHVASASKAPRGVVLTFALPAGEVPGVKKGELRVHFSGSARSPLIVPTTLVVE